MGELRECRERPARARSRRLHLAALLRAWPLCAAGCLYENCGAESAQERAGMPASWHIPSEPCEDRRTPIPLGGSDEQSERALEAMGWVEGRHSERISWFNGSHSSIEIEVSDLQANFVDSRVTPDFIPGTDNVTCEDYLELLGSATIRSGDGRLAEGPRELSLRVRASQEAFGQLSFDPDELQGAYTPLARPNRCFMQLQIKVLLGESGFHGSINELISQRGCDVEARIVDAFVAGHWGSRWQSY